MEQSNLSRTSLETARSDQATQYTLGEIIASLGLPETMATWEQIATDLSRLAHKSPPWGKKYVHNVYHGHLLPSKAFAIALDKLKQSIAGAPAGTEGTAMVKVFADPERIPEGTFIPVNAVVQKCKRAGCPIHFVKTNYFQEYHDPSCRRKK